ncbi:MAG TPA: hypothetical protein VN193_01025 [Candidatus Angelobacter sp.]|jgi:hypothetical protein|nr:hypothetical protein [Candidatus Angelobacter sp.]
MVTNVILGAVLVGLLIGFAAFYRYSRTDAFRHGDVRRATFNLLLVIGPFFGVHPKPPEPEPTSIATPKGDTEDPLAERVQITTPGAEPEEPTPRP